MEVPALEEGEWSALAPTWNPW